MAVQDWSRDPALNSNIDGVNIAEGCPPGNMNDMGRRIMASVRVMFDGLTGSSGGPYVAQTGGVFLTQPTFQGRGGFLHNNDASAVSGRVFVQPLGGTPPAGAAGDWLVEI